MYKYLLTGTLLIVTGFIPAGALSARMEQHRSGEHHEIQHHQVQHQDVQHHPQEMHPNHPNEHKDVNRNADRNLDRREGDYHRYPQSGLNGEAVVLPVNGDNNNGNSGDYDPNAEEDALYNQDVQQMKQTPSEPQTINVNVNDQGGSQ